MSTVAIAATLLLACPGPWPGMPQHSDPGAGEPGPRSFVPAEAISWVRECCTFPEPQLIHDCLAASADLHALCNSESRRPERAALCFSAWDAAMETESTCDRTTKNLAQYYSAGCRESERCSKLADIARLYVTSCCNSAVLSTQLADSCERSLRTLSNVRDRALSSDLVAGLESECNGPLMTEISRETPACAVATAATTIYFARYRFALTFLIISVGFILSRRFATSSE